MHHRWQFLVIAAFIPANSFAQNALPSPRTISTPADVHALALGPDGKTLITLDETKTARVWDVERGTHELLHKDTNWLESLSLRPDGKVVAVHTGNQVHLLDVALRKKLTTLTGRSPMFSPDGKWLAINRGTEAELYDAETFKSVHTIRAYQVKLDHLAFRPAEKGHDAAKPVLATIGQRESKGQLWNVAGKQRELFFYSRNNEQLGHHLAFRSDGKVLAATGGEKNTDVLLWNFTGDLPAADLLCKDSIKALAFRPNSNHLAVASFAIEIFDAGTQQSVARAGVKLGPVTDLAFSADGNTLVAASRTQLNVWDLSKVPSAPIGPVAKNPAGKMPESKSSYNAYLEELLDMQGSDLPELVVEPVERSRLYERPFLTFDGKPHGDPGPSVLVAVRKHLSPLTTDMRLVKDNKTADIKDFRLGDLVEVSYSSRRYPSTEIIVVEHDAARTRRQEDFVAALKPLAPKNDRRFPRARFSPSELNSLRREKRNEKREALEAQAAHPIFKLIEKNPDDRQSFNFLTELMAMANPAVHKKAAELMVEHQLKNEQIKGFLSVPRLRQQAPDELFVRLLEQKEAPELRAGACMTLANRWYHRGKVGQEKDSKKVLNKETTAQAIRYHEQLKKEFATESMADMQRLETAFPPRKAASAWADERLAEMRGVWAGLPKQVLPGEPAPALTGIDATGNKIALSDFKGKIVVVRILHTDAVFPSKVGIPPPKKKKGAPAPPGRFDQERSLQERFKDMIVCVLVTWDGPKDALREYLQRQKVDWPVIRVDGSTFDYSQKMMKEWPTRSAGVFILDPRGNVRLREYTFPRELGETIEGLLSEGK